MWLLRGQLFTCKALQSAQANASEELDVSFNKAYEGTLKPHHNFVVKRVFAVAMKACPYRADFFTKVKADPAGGPPSSDEHLNERLNQWLTGLDGIVTRVQTFYKAGGHDKGF